jgi:hypothetical protein
VEQYKPAIVVSAYNRAHSLKRLLKSLSCAFYNSNVTLVISIDKSNSDDVFEVANNFEWYNGEKIIIKHKENLGLKNHILECGNLTSIYGSIILLEDDLYVSPFFYMYATGALNNYCADTNIAGISLYAHSFNIHAKLPFIPMLDDSSIYFLQLPSSWGQAWTDRQWNDFLLWFSSEENNKDYQSPSIPRSISEWPNKSSWLKIFSKYIIEENKYFVYPYVSLSTNFGDAGVHFKRKFFFTQVVLQNVDIIYKFKDFEFANAVYDAYFEILPSKLKLKAISLVNYDFEVDFYGYKPLHQSEKPYFLTIHFCEQYEKSFGLDFKPIEFNIINDNQGQQIFLVKKSDFEYKKRNRLKSVLFEYHYRMPLLAEFFNLLALQIRQRINERIS